ncbi:MAG TPA: hypothetical protein VLH86_06015 [Patescibacteria group bacterium]|nr:hypothetical protein [Patescibacteria group bacterium]
MTAQQIYNEILAYTGPTGIANWYVGITSDIEERLFGYHNVHRTDGAWYHAQALDHTHSRAVESSLLELGFDGGVGGGDHTATYVYAFRKDFGTVR